MLFAPRYRHAIMRWALNCVIFAAATAAALLAQSLERPITAVLVYIVGVIAIGAQSGLRAGVVAALAASLVYNFLLAEPQLSFGVRSLDDIVPLVAFVVSALLSGVMSGRLRDSAARAQQAELRSENLLKLSDRLQPAMTVEEVAEIVARHFAGTLRTEVVLRVSQLTDRSPAPPEEAHTAADDAEMVIALDGPSRTLGTLTVYPSAHFMEAEHSPDWQAVAGLLVLAIERCQLLEEVAETRARQHSEALKDAILSSVSHDLRTPLTTIEAAASALLSAEIDLPEEARRSLLESILDQSLRLNRFTAELLDVGRIQAGISPERLHNVDIVEIIAFVLGQVRSEFPDQKIEKVLSVESAVVRANASMLGQAIFNLVDNAVKHGGRGSKVSIRLESDGERALLEIADNGKGIALADQARIFERFHRGTRSDGTQGSGLGLFVTRGFVEAFGGEIHVVSPVRAGRGTAFRIAFPLVCDKASGSEDKAA